MKNKTDSRRGVKIRTFGHLFHSEEGCPSHGKLSGCPDFCSPVQQYMFDYINRRMVVGRFCSHFVVVNESSD